MLGKAVVVPAAFDALFAEIRRPCLGIKAGSAAADPETQGFRDQRFDLLLIVDQPGDALGAPAMVGGARKAGAISSRGRGILEVEEEIKGEIRSLVAEGYRITAVEDGDSDALEDEAGRYLAYRTYAVLARCTEDRYYHPPRNLVATGGVGSVTLSWTLPPDRYDRFRMILRRAAGATPPSSPTAGTGVSLASDLATSKVDAGLAAGTYSYSLWAAYDETHPTPSVEERYSSAETGTSRASVSVT